MLVQAVVLSAGRGRRMGRPKHLLPLPDGGGVMLDRVLAALKGSRGMDPVVVLRPGDAAGCERATALGCRSVWAEDEDEGRAASVRAGVRASPEQAAILFALADQPWLLPGDFDALIERAGDAAIVQASYLGQRGSPVLFGPALRPELLALFGGEGGRVLIERHRGEVIDVALDPVRGRDVDRLEDLR